jgi:hypothetical protein
LQKNLEHIAEKAAKSAEQMVAFTRAAQITKQDKENTVTTEK